MKLKTRLVVSFLLIILLPLFLAGILGSAVVIPQLLALNQAYDITEADVGDYVNSSFSILSRVNHVARDRILDGVAENPDTLKDEEVLEHVSQQLEKRNSYLVIMQGKMYTYISANDPDMNVINRAVVYHDISDFEFLEEYGQIFSSLNVEFSDGSEASVYVFTKTNNILPEIKRILWSVFATLIIILALTAGAMVYWIYSSIVRPVGALRVAAQNIRDGHLDFDIEIRNDEMGELAKDIDDMRLRLKKSAEEKVAYDEESRQLISNISHDLKTPLTAIKGYVEGLEDGIANTPEKQQKYIHVISTKVNDMTKLIDELSLYSKIDTNKIPYNYAELSVKDYFEDCAYDIEQELNAKGFEFSYINYLKSDAHIFIDPEQFNRVINNIISNSIKYMDKSKGRINLRVSETQDTILIEEEDNGCGISEEDLPNVFDRFYRADRSRKSTGGSGIGLAIVKKIVSDHKGRIWASSTLGAGTIMHIELPKYIEEAKEA